MGEMIGLLQDLKKIHQDERADKRVVGAAHLATNKIKFTAHNSGAHLVIVTSDNKQIDYWPGTGKFNVVGGSHVRGGRVIIANGYDLAGLCDYLKIPKP